MLHVDLNKYNLGKIIYSIFQFVGLFILIGHTLVGGFTLTGVTRLEHRVH